MYAIRSYYGDPWYKHIKDDMEGVTELGEESQPNIELIASLKPDLIIGNKMRQEKIYSQLSAIAPTVFSETLRGEWKNNFTLYAKALNKEAEGQKVIADFDKKIEDFKVAAGDKLKQKVSVVRFMGGKTRIYLEDTFTGIIFVITSYSIHYTKLYELPVRDSVHKCWWKRSYIWRQRREWQHKW